MNEQFRPSREQQAGPGGLGSIFDELDELPGQVRVSCGPHEEMLPVSNMTVGEIRRRFGPRMDIDERAQAVVDGQNVGNDTTVRQGQELMFTHPAGEKGIAPLNRRELRDSLNHPPRWRPRRSRHQGFISRKPTDDGSGRGVYAASAPPNHRQIVSSVPFGLRSGLKAALQPA